MCVFVLYAVPPHVEHRKQMPHPWLWESEKERLKRRERGRAREAVFVLEHVSRDCTVLWLLFHIVPQSDTQRGTRIIKQRLSLVRFSGSC